MPTFAVDGVNLHYEVEGSGYPLLFSHEFAGDIRSWEPQVNFFARRYQVITWCARGYPPSDVPDDPAAYSQERAVADAHALLAHLGIGQAHIAGLSMGASLSLNFAIAHPEMCRSVVVAATGTGSDDRESFRQAWQENSEQLLTGDMAGFAESYANGPQRVQFRRKDPAGWAKFFAQLAEHSPLGSGLTMRGVQMRRAAIYELEEQLRGLQVPTLLLVGDEDEPCLNPTLFMKRHIPNSGLAMFPQSGHTINLEEPALFNRTVLDFLTAVEANRWGQ